MIGNGILKTAPPLVPQVLDRGFLALASDRIRGLLRLWCRQDLAGHRLVALLKLILQVVVDVRVLGRQECRGNTRLASPARPTNPVRVVLDVLRAVVVDDVLDARNVDATPGNICADDDLEHTALEVVQRRLSRLLGLATVKARSPEAILQHLLVERVGHLSRIDKHHDGRLLPPARFRVWSFRGLGFGVEVCRAREKTWQQEQVPSHDERGSVWNMHE
jgi:hypothetical protein